MRTITVLETDPSMDYLERSITEFGVSEYSASEIRKLLQGLFPERRLVLSQFTFFNQVGVARPTGQTFCRGRRRYRLQDLLSIACVLALKEEGIPLKNIEEVPALLQAHADAIFEQGEGCRITGVGDTISLTMKDGTRENGVKDTDPLDRFLSGESQQLFWGFDVGVLAMQLKRVADDVAGASVRAAA